MGTITADPPTDLDMSAGVDLESIMDDVVPCESEGHDQGIWGHVATDPASYRVTAPCRAVRNNCAGVVLFLLTRRRINCVSCGTKHLVEDMRIQSL